MKLLILDSTAEAQTRCAKRIEQFSRTDIEMLDLRVKLVDEKDFSDKLHEADVLIIGSGVGENGVVLARQASTMVPWLRILMFVSVEAYGGGAFRAAYAAGVRKVFPDTALHVDLLQELIAISAEFKKEGRTKEGRVITVTHAKGGVGCTSVVAALGEVCSVYNRRTLLVDLDVETRDLCRALNVNGAQAKLVANWVNGTSEITRESVEEAVIPISSEAGVLMPPNKMAESIDLVCHADGMSIIERLVEISRVLNDVVIFDTAGRLGPATGALLRCSDVVLIVLDDSVLGRTAVDLYLTYVKMLVGDTDRIVFLVNPFAGADYSPKQIAAELEPLHHLGEGAWKLPPLPNDPRAASWPASGSTLYGMGSKMTRAVLERIAGDLGLIQESQLINEGLRSIAIPQSLQEEYGQKASTNWLSKLMGK